MNTNMADSYKTNAILTASPAELTLMLYDGAIKFCNIALIALEKNDYGKCNENLKRAQDIILEFRITLDHKYPVWEDFDRVFEYIYNCLIDGNIHKDKEMIEEGLGRIREMRDTWKEVMQLNNQKVD
ncbi:flagellar export chaperone FliS [Eubacterium xylanophilum]|uniref:flagellar export chaperone FliS n=1 Tax=Eubacterium xylanophilum TaxID=39497 RepID=UPI00047C434A|nr:flagellar export chaperone FliS [Eubacterium xylanophilum]MCR5798272.1 flagellar export chaperone FliS [Eubacterium sp.]